LTVKAATPPPALSRTRYVRTDATTLYFTMINASWIVFDSNTHRFFVSDPDSNQIMVLDSLTRKEMARIAVPGAYGIDLTPDHTVLYAGTQVGDVYAIDPVTMKVTHRYIGSQIGPYGYAAYSVRVLADGKLVLLGSQGGIPSIDGYGGFAIWNAADNSIVMYGAGPAGATQSNCVGNIGAFTLTGDRALIVEGSIDSDATLCTLDPNTGKRQIVAGVGSLFDVVSSPDGKLLFTPDYQPASVHVIDAATLAVKYTFPVAGHTSSDVAMLVSPDSKILYIPDDSIVYAYDIATGKLLGWMPNLVVEITQGGAFFTVGPATGPNMQAMDDSGIIAGPMNNGVGFIDTTALHPTPVGKGFLNAYLTPATGPAAGGTATQWDSPAIGGVSAAYFGPNPATSVSLASNGFISATTPPGIPGPADVYALFADGGTQIVPEGFSYGPTILEATPDTSNPEGAGTGVLFGYGFGPVGTTAIPADLQVTVGGKSATVTGYDPNAYGLLSPPFLLEALTFTIPAGPAGTAADIAVTTSSGTATLSGGMHYLPSSTQTYSAPGAQLAQGVYDSKRDLYYFTDAAQILVFSRAQGKWLSPIAVPAAPPGTVHRLWGISISPSGGRIAVCDAGASEVFLIDPGNPASVKTFPLTVSNGNGILTYPSGIALCDSGIAYVTAAVLGGTGYSNFFKLDTNAGTLTDLKITGPGLGSSDAMLRTQMSADGTRVFFNNDGAPFSLDTASGQVSWASISPGCCYGDYDLSVSNNQVQMEATDYLYDTDLNAASTLALNDREIQSTVYVYGAKMSPDGSLLFMPMASGIDVFDGRLGILRNRIALPLALSSNYDALVSDGKDNVLLAITGATGNGIAVLDLSSIAEPAPLPYTVSGGAWRGANGSRAGLSAHEGERTRNLKTIHVAPARIPHPLRYAVSSILPQSRSNTGVKPK
jgi:WD40 repeat protein